MASNKLYDAELRGAKAAEKPYKLADGGGLYLLVRTNGSRLWQMGYVFAGRTKTLSFGAYPTVGLSDARDKREAAKKMLGDGRDPGLVKADEKRRAKVDSFEAIAREWFDAKKAGWKTSYSARIWARIEDDILPVVGALPIRSIDAPTLLSALRSIEERGALVLARKVKQTCGQIFRYAIATGRAERDPSADLKGAMKTPPKVKHRAALKARELPTFLTKLDRYEGEEIVKLAVEFALLTFTRTSEIRFAKKTEIEALDGKAPLWRVPPERMKQGREHLVPLSKQAVKVLRRLKEISDSPYLFPSYGKGGVISENAMLYALYNLGYHSKATVHGFRGTASTILNESGKFDSDWIEMQLAHDEDDKVRGAYNAAQYLKQRRPMMQWWADYLDQQRAAGRHRKREVDTLLG